jgi:predicted DNA repair protein MutK
MSGGLFGLLDDIAALAKLAAASIDDVGAAAGRASVKAAGVVVDDTAVTPAYVHGLAAERELPIIKRIATGSLRNKLLIILPAALMLSEFVPIAGRDHPHVRRRLPGLRGRREDPSPLQRRLRRGRRGGRPGNDW